MGETLSVFISFLTQFVGGREGIEHGGVQFGLAAILWGGLIAFSWGRGKYDSSPYEKCLLLGFSLGFARELSMMGMALLHRLEVVDPASLQVFFPPLENALSQSVIIVVAGAFLLYLLENPALGRRYIKLALGATGLCYIATFIWWAHYVSLHPGVSIGQTWCGWLFQLNGCMWLVLPIICLFQKNKGWLRNMVCLAFTFFFLHEFLKMYDMAMGETFEYIFSPIRHSFYLSGIVLLGYVYFRKQTEDLRSSEERYRTLVENINLGISLIDIDHNIVMANRAMGQLMGKSPKEFVGKNRHREYGRQKEQMDVRAQVFPVLDKDGRPKNFIEVIEDVSGAKKNEEKIRKLSYHDTLTGLPNRTLFQENLSRSIALAQRQNQSFALLFLDIDRFKDINDTLGHTEGDSLLEAVAQRLKNSIRESDILARFGGDEFIFLLPTFDDEQDVIAVVEKILELMASPFDLAGKEVFTSASIGVVSYPHDGEDVETLLKHADMAMFAAKERGRNAYQFYSEEMNRKAMEQHELKASLHRALDQNEFFLVYQPQYDLPSGKMIGVEALLRWRHPEKGMIPPVKFIPVAEEIGLIRPIGEWVLRNACMQNRVWQDEGYAPLVMGVNLSGRQFKQVDLVEVIGRILDEAGLDPRYLELELTESILMDSEDKTIKTLQRLKEKGIQLSIDDFGTGYSSLNYLKHFPIDRIKIDRSFIKDITENRDDAAIVEAIIAMAQRLNLQVIAEGVETEDQLSFLQARDCKEMQGYYFAKPALPDELIEHLKSKKRA